MIISHYSDIYKEDLSLRPYQQKAKKEIFEAWDEVDSVLFQMPTGTGKTRLFTSIISDINEYSVSIQEPVKILIVAHRTELIDQIDESLKKYRIAHNVIAGGRKRSSKYPVNVASIQTLTHPNNLAYAKELKVQFVIIDEAHHALATTYKKLWDLYPGSKKLGVTATPWRMNHQSFRDLFETLVMSMPVKDFIRQGYLSPYKYYSIRPNSDIQKIIEGIDLDRFGEYSESSMEEKMDIGSIRAQLLDSYQSLAKGKKGIIYAININHAKHICSEYEAAGYVAVCIDSKTPASQRKEYVERFKQGQIDIIVNVDIFSEGFDCPDIEFIQLARPTHSLVKYLQQVGRGLRITKNKQECIILDNVGMYAQFGLPDARRQWKKHFVGKNVSEKPRLDIFTRTGMGRNVNLSEGTEDMVLIQDSNEEHKLNGNDDPEEELFDPIQLLEENNFKCDNFIFHLNSSKRIYEAYIQDDKYFIISELIIDKNRLRVHRIRVGKISSRSWMFLQMLIENVEGLISITHYSANFTVFHYSVLLPGSTTAEDKYFDYEGREIASPQIVLDKYEQARKEGVLSDNVDVPLSKATYKVELNNPSYILYQTIKDTTMPIAWMLRTSDFGRSHELEVARENEERKFKGIPQIGPQNTDDIRVLRSDDRSFTIKKIEKGKGHLFTYDLNGKLLRARTMVPHTSDGADPLKGDDIEKIKHVFDKKASSYKYFWFMSLLEIYKRTQFENIEYKQILVKMVAKAWKYVFLLQGRFSLTDLLPKYVIDLQVLTGLSKDSLEPEIESELYKKYDSLGLETKLSPLLKNVPYRFLSPWIPFTKSGEVMKESRNQNTRCPYELYPDHLVISKLWRRAFIDYYDCLQLIAEYGLNSYLMVSQDKKEAYDIYNMRFMSLAQLLKGIKRRHDTEIVKQFLEKYHFSQDGKVTPADIWNVMPKSVMVWDCEGKKQVHIPGELWTLNILDKLLSGKEIRDRYDNVQLLSDFGLDEYKKSIHKEEKNAEDIHKGRYASLSKFIREINKNKDDKAVKDFLMKYHLPPTGNLSYGDIIDIIPESKCEVDSDGKKRVTLPGGLWSLKELENLLS